MWRDDITEGCIFLLLIEVQLQTFTDVDEEGFLWVSFIWFMPLQHNKLWHNAIIEMQGWI